MKLFPTAYYKVELERDSATALDELKQDTDITELFTSDWTKKGFRGQVSDRGFKIISSEVGRGAVCVFIGKLQGTTGEMEVRINTAFQVLFSILMLLPILGLVAGTILAGIGKSIGLIIPTVAGILLIRFVFVELSFLLVSRTGLKKLTKVLGIKQLTKVSGVASIEFEEKVNESRIDDIESLAGKGNLVELKKLLGANYSQLELDVALENAIAYSQLETAEYLCELGADFSNYNYNGVYYAAHNNEIEGLKYAISKGVDINVNSGMLLNVSIVTATNTKDIELIKWLLDNGANPEYLTIGSKELVERYGTEDLKKLINSLDL